MTSLGGSTVAEGPRQTGQTEIGGFYAATSIVIAAAAAGGARFRPQPLLLAAIFLVVAGLAVAGGTSAVAVWIAALVCADVGIGAGNTASTGILLDSVGPQRIVTGLVVWSQLGMVGYLLGPLAGGGVAETLGFGALVIVPLAAAACVVATYFWARSS